MLDASGQAIHARRPASGSVGDSRDGALAETASGLLETEVVRRLGPWRRLEAVEIATPRWVDRFESTT